jgi:hypothetical protein
MVRGGAAGWLRSIESIFARCSLVMFPPARSVAARLRRHAFELLLVTRGEGKRG